MQMVQYSPDDPHIVTMNNAMLNIRKIFVECDKVGPDVAYTVLVSLIADSVLLAEHPDEWFQELVDSVQQCRVLKLQALMQEGNQASRH